MSLLKQTLEQWKEIPNSKLQGLYWISNMGRIKKIAHMTFKLTEKKESIVSTHIHKNVRIAHLNVTDNRGQRYSNNYNVGQLVAKAFVPNPFKYFFIAYKNNDMTDLRAENIFWTVNNHQNRVK